MNNGQNFVFTREQKQPFVKKIVTFSVLTGVSATIGYVGLILISVLGSMDYLSPVGIVCILLLMIIPCIVGLAVFIPNIVKWSVRMKHAKDEARHAFSVGSSATEGAQTIPSEKDPRFDYYNYPESKI